tara:strand:- start:99 stop:848 length:750 start_codon:yes stop_codon:yes gene_type:complete
MENQNFLQQRAMWLKASDLHEFYDSPLGMTAQRMISEHVREIWPDVSGMELLGVGFPTPFLNAFRSEAARVLMAVPVYHGITHLPIGNTKRACLTSECELPFPDLSMDRILLVHVVECAETLRPMMREIWRVLSGNGRLLVIAPNRRGIWARLEHTPFGHGRPYTSSQLYRLLRETLFKPVSKTSALYIPPAKSRMIISSAPAVEKLGKRWFPALGGIVSVEAEKEIYAVTPLGQGTRQTGYATVTDPP